jgi:hypothetical protein
VEYSKSKYRSGWALALGFLILLTIGIRYAEPVKDSDLWFQMSYGRYLLEHRTLIPDHTVFTWTPADSRPIYCAWTSQIFLYLLYKVGGLPALFSLRYLCLLIYVFIFWLFARRLGQSSHPLTWLICLLGILMSRIAVFAKPEIISYVFMTLAVAGWWYIKSAGKRGYLYCYMFPLIVVLWVNSHGGFIFGGIFLLLIGLGELLNVRFSPDEALSPNVRKHLYLSLLLCGLAVFVTPYGWRYPFYLVGSFLGPHYLGGDMANVRVVDAYLAPFKVDGIHFLLYFVLSWVILGSLLVPRLWKGRVDWVLVLTNLGFSVIFTWFLRSTYYWVPIFSFSAVHLLAIGPKWASPRDLVPKLALAGATLGVSLFISGQALYEAKCQPGRFNWLGFGISYQNPVEEAEYLKSHFSGYRIGNDYNVGAYLSWALWPENKVLIDARMFPFRKWYEAYLKFTRGTEVGGFVKRFPCDIWCLSLEKQKTIAWFRASSEWRRAFYGPSAVIYVRKGVPLPENAERVGRGVLGVKNFDQAAQVLFFSINDQDFQTGQRVVSSMTERFNCPNLRPYVQAASDFLDGVQFCYRREYEKAVASFEACRRTRFVRVDGWLVYCYHQLTSLASERGDVEEVLTYQEKVLKISPTDLYGLFNAGALGWYVDRESKPARAVSPSGPPGTGRLRLFGQGEGWSRDLQLFVQIAGRNPRGLENLIALAKGILSHTFHGRPPVIVPPEQRPVTEQEGEDNGGRF